MKLVIMVLALVFASAVVHADGVAASYWVAGSYDRLADARMERLELQKSLGAQVKIGRFDRADGTRFRLVIPFSHDQEAQLSRLKAAGLSPWTMSADNSGFSFVNDSQDQTIEYRLIVGSFTTEYAANEFARSLKQKGLENMTVLAMDTGTAIGYRVMSPPYDHRESSVRDAAVRAGISNAWWIKVLGNTAPIMATADPGSPIERHRPE